METTGTIRAYFVFFGFFDAFVHYVALGEGREVAWISLIGLARGVSYLCVGLALSALLNRYARLVESVLIAGLCYSFLLAYARMFLYQEQETLVEVISRLIPTVFLTLYVFNHVERLSVGRNPSC